jgi:putative ABC transport system ATP-binding protein
VTLAECREVDVVYGAGDAAVHALADVSVSIDDAETVALLGRSGSGKTTLLHVLGRLVRPTSGEVEAPAPPRLAYVFQSANLLPNLNAFENVAFAVDVVGGETASAAELLELVGLHGKLDHLPGELSGGEAQRVAIARALAQQPRLLLCDEPTGHLDSDTGGRVLDLLSAVQARLRFALVVATHDPDVAARMSRDVELEDGRIVRDERP